MEMSAGSDVGTATGRRLFKRGRSTAEGLANTRLLGSLLTSWGSLEAERGHEVEALRLLKAAAAACPYNAQAWLMWAHVTSHHKVMAPPVCAQPCVLKAAAAACPYNAQAWLMWAHVTSHHKVMAPPVCAQPVLFLYTSVSRAEGCSYVADVWAVCLVQAHCRPHLSCVAGAGGIPKLGRAVSRSSHHQHVLTRPLTEDRPEGKPCEVYDALGKSLLIYISDKSFRYWFLSRNRKLINSVTNLNYI
jgi:hypothetical protein